MKNLRFVLFAMVLALFIPFAQAQYNPKNFDVNQNTVVAVSGLKMRSRPSLKGKVISKIPFGETIDIIDTKHHGHDTLASNYKVYFSNDEFYEPILSGFWVKTRYEGEEGYVFNAFLYYDYDKSAPTFNKKTALLFEGSSCYDNLHYRPDWHWYGIFEKEGIQYLEKVKLDLLVEESEFEGLLTITTDKEQASLFIIGSPRPLKERRLFFSEYLGTGTTIYRGGEMTEQVLKDAALEIRDQEGEDYPLIVAIGSQGEQQILNPEEPYLNYSTKIQWFGDLDGDGKMDYLIEFGDKTSRNVLFLSTKAGAGQLVAPVGAYFSGYCC